MSNPLTKVSPFGWITVGLSVFFLFYWGLWASDRYVSEARIIIQKTDLSLAQTPDISSLISGTTGVNRADQLLLRNHLLSLDMLKALEAQFMLRAHYSDTSKDFLSRLWLDDAPMEWLYRYFLNRVTIELDEYDGVLIIKSEAFNAVTAHAMTEYLVKAGEAFMNKMAQELALDQVAFLEKQVSLRKEDALAHRQRLLQFQNQQGTLSPQETAEAIAQVIAKLSTQKSELETQRSGLQSYLVPSHASIVLLNQQILALKKQIEQEQSKLTSQQARTLNQSIEEYQRLEMEAQFSQEMYQSALIALEKGRVEAARNLKKVSVLQQSSLPEYPWEPRRLYWSFVSVLLVFLMTGILYLIVAIIKDHKD